MVRARAAFTRDERQTIPAREPDLCQFDIAQRAGPLVIAIDHARVGDRGSDCKKTSTRERNHAAPLVCDSARHRPDLPPQWPRGAPGDERVSASRALSWSHALRPARSPDIGERLHSCRHGNVLAVRAHRLRSPRVRLTIQPVFPAFASVSTPLTTPETLLLANGSSGSAIGARSCGRTRSSMAMNPNHASQ